MSNVVLNPDFSAGGGGFRGTPTYWSHETWEPLLSIGHSLGGSAAIPTPPGITYFVEGEGRNELGLFPGLLYSGPGFDAGPGDTWTIQFDYQWVNGDPEWQTFEPVGPTNNHDIFFRYGITIWNEATQHWDTWYASCPAHPIPLPPDPRTANGAAAVYFESFVIPGNFPTATYQFAICHTPNTFTQAQWESASGLGVHRGYGYSMFLNNVDLQKTAGGGSGPGSAPGSSFYSFWPTPRFQPGYPGIPSPPPRPGIPGSGTPPQLGFDIGIEWDQFALNGPMQIQRTTFPHSGATAYLTTPGMFDAGLCFQDGWPLPGTPADIWYGALGADDWVTVDGGNDFAGLNSNVVGAVLLPATTTALFFRHISADDPITFECGQHRFLIERFGYMTVGIQEALHNTLFGTEAVYLPESFTEFWHPEARPNNGPGFADGGGRLLAFSPGLGLALFTQEFDYNLSCQPISDVRVWQRYG